MEPHQTESDRHQAIQLAAYCLWQQRDCPFGSPEVDWFQAEEQLNQHLDNAHAKLAVVAVAEAVGSALGSVAGLASSVVHLVHPSQPSEPE